LRIDSQKNPSFRSNSGLVVETFGVLALIQFTFFRELRKLG